MFVPTCTNSCKSDSNLISVVFLPSMALGIGKQPLYPQSLSGFFSSYPLILNWCRCACFPESPPFLSLFVDSSFSIFMSSSDNMHVNKLCVFLPCIWVEGKHELCSCFNFGKFHSQARFHF